VKVANMAKVVQEGWQDKPFRFWTPAFKIRPQDFLLFSRNLTLSQPPKEWVAKLPKGEVLSVTMPVTEALESLKINLASFIKPPKMLHLLEEMEIKPKGIVLVYIPLQKSGNELFQPAFNLRTTRTLLEYAKLL